MKIESLRVENFGILSELKLDFEEKNNVIIRENGWGKSTLASFIRAMFYGFEGEGKQGIVANERRRFKPWQGGVYGGSIVFETKGVRYEITRTFGNKIAEDTFELRNKDTNLPSDKFSSNIGEELFHINSESFMRTMFIKQNDCSLTQTTGDINSRIGNISDSIDINKFEDANKLLTDAITHLGTRKNSRQGELNEEISRIKGVLYSYSTLDDSIKEVEDRIEKREKDLLKIKNEKAELDKRKARHTFLAEKIAKKKQYDELKAEYDFKKKEVEEALINFGGNVVEKERMAEWDKAFSDCNNLNNIYETNKLSDAEEVGYQSYCNMFKNGIPESDEISGLIESGRRLEELKAISEGVSLSSAEKDKLSFYKTLFGIVSNPVSDINIVISKWNNMIRKKDELLFLENDIKREEEDLRIRTEGKKKNKELRLSGIIFAIFGVVLFLVKNFILSVDLWQILQIISIVFIVAGIACIGVSLIKKDKGNNLTKEEEDLLKKKQNRTNLEQEANATFSEVKSFIENHGMVFDEGNADGSLHNLLESAYEYKELLKKNEKALNKNYYEEISGIEKKIKEFLSSYSVDVNQEEYLVNLTRLSNNVISFKGLEEKKNESLKAKTQSEKLHIYLEDQLKHYGFVPSINLESQLNDIKEKIEILDSKQRLFKDAEERMKKFEESADIVELMEPISEEYIISSEELNNQSAALSEKEDEINSYLRLDRNSLEAYRDKFEQRTDLESELENLEAQLEDAKDKQKLYEETRKYLNQAKESMTSRYIGPLFDGFSKYYEIMTGESAEEYSLDANLDLTRREAGAQRSKDSLSYGYRDLIGLCMRIAMTDAMYKGEKPVLVLDDPFVNLDDGKMDGARKLLKGISDNYQVIYLTCRENRL